MLSNHLLRAVRLRRESLDALDAMHLGRRCSLFYCAAPAHQCTADGMRCCRYSSAGGCAPPQGYSQRECRAKSRPAASSAVWDEECAAASPSPAVGELQAKGFSYFLLASIAKRREGANTKDERRDMEQKEKKRKDK